MRGNEKEKARKGGEKERVGKDGRKHPLPPQKKILFTALSDRLTYLELANLRVSESQFK